MNFVDYKKSLSEQFGISQRNSKLILEFIQIEMRKDLIFGKEIGISGIGKFKREIRTARIIKNLHTSKPLHVSARYKLTFKPFKNFRTELSKRTVYGG